MTLDPWITALSVLGAATYVAVRIARFVREARADGNDGGCATGGCFAACGSCHDIQPRKA